MWSGVPVVVGAHETIEISDITPFRGLGMGDKLAHKMTKELVDNIFVGKAKVEQEVKGDFRYQAPSGQMMGVPMQRKPYEDKILVSLGQEEDEGAVKIIKQQLKTQLQEDANRQEGVQYEPAKEFLEIPRGGLPNESKAVARAARTKKA